MNKAKDGANERINRQVILARHPEGIAGPDDFEVRDAPIPTLAPGQILVENHYIGVDAALRLIVRDSDEFLFRVQPGDLIHAGAAGRVIESLHSDLKVGDYVAGSFGAQSVAVSDGIGVERCDLGQAPLGSWLGGFGTSGLTAYFALFHECKPQPGQTLLVNGAAGAVGSMAGQFAKLAGARVIGITSSAAKCAWLTDVLGYDVAINYNEENWVSQLEAAAPERIDVIFDNVGGAILNDSLKFIALHGVVLLCGSTSQYSQAEMQGPSNYIWLGTMRARLQGFVVFDYEEHYAQARSRISTWLKQDRLQLPEFTLVGDVDKFPEAFQQLYLGANLGKMLLQLPTAGD